MCVITELETAESNTLTAAGAKEPVEASYTGGLREVYTGEEERR
jgi:hypothetical protein